MYIEPRLPDHSDIWTANLNGIVDSVLNNKR